MASSFFKWLVRWVLISGLDSFWKFWRMKGRPGARVQAMVFSWGIIFEGAESMLDDGSEAELEPDSEITESADPAESCLVSVFVPAVSSNLSTKSLYSSSKVKAPFKQELDIFK